MHSNSFSSLLANEGDLDLEELHIPQNPTNKLRSEWESFTAPFTQQFEQVKAEVEGLRAEVKHLKRTVRELKVRKETLPD